MCHLRGLGADCQTRWFKGCVSGRCLLSQQDTPCDARSRRQIITDCKTLNQSWRFRHHKEVTLEKECALRGPRCAPRSGAAAYSRRPLLRPQRVRRRGPLERSAARPPVRP